MDCNIVISPVKETDIPSILEIELESQPEPWSARAFLEEINRVHSNLLVARLKESLDESAGLSEIAGYICFWLVADEIQILNIAVRKTRRRNGIAGRLIETAIQIGLKCNAGLVTLEVRESNLPARNLYESLGFRIVGERSKYYGVQAESAILMELELPGRPNS